ncbi:hypothetical protein [Paradesulfitobacterium ferrireducens]|uniref:hypothetical protein n=1 Tax=Paradesulfitobacterium ferrireducens TaxID=2816476 RepID=UPI001A8CB5BA|nr:hypothetical protein [Paradesulfitobacterium ferrireducens]
MYSSILLALSLTKVDMTAFVSGMLPLVILLFLLGYFFYVRKIPKEFCLEFTPGFCRQVSPTHICLAIVTEEFKILMFDLVKARCLY